MQTVKDVKHLTNLRRWVMSHGGWIHPAVVCGLSPNFGCRSGAAAYARVDRPLKKVTVVFRAAGAC